MKFYSEKLDKLFDTEELLNKAEIEAHEKEVALKKETEAKELQKTNEKKELAKSVEIAENELDIKYKEYDSAKEQARAILKDAQNKANKLVSDAYNNVKKAQENKYKAVENFNKKFGAYTKVYNGTDAYKEYLKTVDRFNSLFSDYFNRWF